MSRLSRLLHVTGFALLVLHWGTYGISAEPVRRDVPPGVIKLFEQLRTIAGRNSWTYRIGGSAGACNVNWGAHKRCLLIDGRRLGDAVAFTALLGWYERTKDVLGTVYFENGESLLIRANGDRLAETGGLSLEGLVSGTLRGAPVDSRFLASRKGELWMIELRPSDGAAVQGVLGSPPSSRSVPSK